MPEIITKERFDKVLVVANEMGGNELSPAQLFYNISYGDYYLNTKRNLAGNVVGSVGFCKYAYDHNGNSKTFTAVKGNNAQVFGEAISNNGPKLVVYLNIASEYFDLIGEEGIKSFSFCVKYALACLPKYLRCLLSKKDYQVNKKPIRPLFDSSLIDLNSLGTKPGYYINDNNALALTDDSEHKYFCNNVNHGRKGHFKTNPYKEVIEFGDNTICVDSIMELSHRKLSKPSTFSGITKNTIGELLIPLFEVEFTKAFGRSPYSILQFSELVTSVFKAILLTICPYVITGDKKVSTVDEKDIMLLLPANCDLKMRRIKLLNIFSTNFNPCLFFSKDNLRDNLDKYSSMLVGGLVFNRIFRERINYYVENTTFIPTIFLAKKFRKIK